MLIHSLLLTTLETALSHFTRLDPDAALFLEPLNGKIIQLDLLNPDFTLFLCPTADNIQILESYQAIPDTCLQGSVMDFAVMGLRHRPMDSLFAGKITVSGDVKTGRDFQNLFERLEIDWEEQISRLTGDVIGHQIGRIFRSARNWSRESIDSFKLNVTEYLQEETRDLPTRIETNHFFSTVDNVRADFDRLEARVQRLLRNTDA